MNKALIEKYKKAMFEADRFSKIAKIALSDIKNYEYYCGGKNTAAAKRASMDLTRALAELRKSR